MVMPQRPFRAESLFVPFRMARHFCVTRVHVGVIMCVIESLSNDAGVPAEFFAWSCGHDQCEGTELDADGNPVDTDPRHAAAFMAACVKNNPELHRGQKLAFVDAMPGIQIQIEALNLSDKPQPFHAVLEGYAIE